MGEELLAALGPRWSSRPRELLELHSARSPRCVNKLLVPRRKIRGTLATAKRTPGGSL